MTVMSRWGEKVVHILGLDPCAGLPPLDGIPGPALVLAADGVVLDANDDAVRLVRAMDAGELAQARRELAVLGAREAGGRVSVALRDDSGSVECDLTAVPLGRARVLVLAQYRALDRSLRAALMDSRQRYKELVEISSDFAWETGPDGAFTFVSPAGALGWAADELVGRPAEAFLDEVHGGEAGALAAASPFRARRALRAAEVRFRRADGAFAILSAAVRPLTDGNGGWAGARGICRDVTEARERDAALARAHVRERLFGYILRAMRDETDPTGMLAAAAAAIARALTAQGTEVHRIGMAGPARAAAFGAESPLPTQGPIATALGRTGTIGAGDEVTQALAVATRYQGAVNGALYIWRRADLGPFGEDERAIAADAAQHLGIAIEQISAHEQLQALSATDPLTGLLNRRSFLAELARRFGRASRADSGSGWGAGALVYCDLDNFKQVNDTHGHERGDAAIRELARLLKGSTRGEDLVARIGGDEFALWLEGAGADAAAAKAEQLLERGRGLAAYSGAPDRPLGMSLGIAVVEPGSGEALDALMARADQAMYAAKRSGKGAARVAPAPLPRVRPERCAGEEA